MKCPVCNGVAHEMRQCPAFSSVAVCTTHCKQCNCYRAETFSCNYHVTKEKPDYEAIEKRLFVIGKQIAKRRGLLFYYQKINDKEAIATIEKEIYQFAMEKRQLENA